MSFCGLGIGSQASDLQRSVCVLEGEYELGVCDHPTKVFKAGETFYEATGRRRIFLRLQTTGNVISPEGFLVRTAGRPNVIQDCYKPGDLS